MLVKNLLKVSLILTFGLSVTACGQNENPNSTKVAMTEKVETSKKIKSNRWEDFQQGFKKKTTVADAVNNAGIKSINDSVNKEYGVRKITMADRIDLKKWKEFQKAFTERVEVYMANISKALG